MRQRICDRLEFLGLYVDEDKNASVRLDNFAAAEIQQPHSRIRVIVTETREQWMIAKEVNRLLVQPSTARTTALPAIPVALSAHQTEANP